MTPYLPHLQDLLGLLATWLIAVLMLLMGAWVTDRRTPQRPTAALATHIVLASAVPK
jgi:hypothetical protein